MSKLGDLLSNVAKAGEDVNSLLEGVTDTNGSLLRLRYLADSIPHVRRLRKKLWGSFEPLSSVESGMNLATALEEVWAWVQNSPEDKRLEKTVVFEIDANGVETPMKEVLEVKLPISLMKMEEGRFVTKPLPSTSRAYDLSNAVRSLKGSNAPWWRGDGAALYLTTGHFERTALPRWTVARAGVRAVSGKARAYAHIEVHDVGSVSPTEVADAYKSARQEMVGWIGDAPKFEVTAGRPEEYPTEVLAQIELELILEKADERFARGESVRPEVWTYRPGPKALAEAWKRRATSLGIGTDKVPSKQSISNFQSRVHRDTYEAALNDMWTDDDNQKAVKEAERNDKRVRKAFDRTPKE